MIKLALVLVVALLAGCGSQNASAQEDDPLAGTVFRSTGITENGADRPLATGNPIELRFGTDGTMAVRAACNRIGGPVTVGADRLRVGELEQTEMGCDEPRMADDRWLTAFFGADPAWRLEGRDLLLTGDRAEIRFEPAHSPSPSVTGRRWVVTGLVDGESVSSVPAGVEAYLSFEDGRVTGSGGCNRLSGPVALDGDEARFGPVVTTKMACGDAADATERAVLGVLRGTVTVALDGPTMRLTAGRTGLVLRAG